MSAPPPELASLRERTAELSDLSAIGALLFWDQSTMMPPGGAPARAHHAATLQRIAHDALADPEIGRLLDALEPWARDEDPDSDDARLVRWMRRDFEKAVRVPASLAADIARAGALGEQAWAEARAASDFGLFRDAFAYQLELRHRYVACFDGYAHPYDVLLDDFEPDLTLAQVRPLLAAVREGVVPLVEAAAGVGERNGGVLHGHFPVDDQRRAMHAVLAPLGFDEHAWRLDPSPHPFAQACSPHDVRITTLYDERDLGVSLYSVLHEFGHGLYEAGVAGPLERTPLADPVSLGVHESQSRLWENIVGRSREFCRWALPHLQAAIPGALDGLDAERMYRGVNAVKPGPIRIFADETTYNLHIVLRVELEVALLEGALALDDLPQAWNDGMWRLLGVEVVDDASGVLQDIHWGAGLFGYFATYTIGNLMAAQLWDRLRADIPDVLAQIGRGDFAALRAWLGEHVHRHGRKFAPVELLWRVTGEELRVEPFVRYLSDKLADAGALAP